MNFNGDTLTPRDEMGDHLRQKDDLQLPHRAVRQAAGVQCNRLRSGGLGIPERIGTNTDYGLSEDWASTRGNGPQVGGL